MKLIFFTFVLTATLALNVKAGDVETPKNTNKGEVVINKSLQSLIDIPGVKSIYEECKRNNTVTANPDENSRTKKVRSRY